MAQWKKGWGIVEITRNTIALSKWALSYNLRAHIASDARIMSIICMDDQLVHKESTQSRFQRDQQTRCHCTTLMRFDVFSTDQQQTLRKT